MSSNVLKISTDRERQFLKSHTNNLTKAVSLLTAYLLDDVDIYGYTAWTLMDNLEWATGFAERFGLFYVNRSDPNLPRVAKASVANYSTIITCNGFPDPALEPHECLNTEPEGKLQSCLGSLTWSIQK